jgi:hypothetical protein
MCLCGVLVMVMVVAVEFILVLVLVQLCGYEGIEVCCYFDGLSGSCESTVSLLLHATLSVLILAVMQNKPPRKSGYL